MKIQFKLQFHQIISNTIHDYPNDSGLIYKEVDPKYHERKIPHSDYWALLLNISEIRTYDVTVTKLFAIQM